jgi:hypothetical protein
VFFAWQTAGDCPVVLVRSVEGTPSVQLFDVVITSAKPFVGIIDLKDYSVVTVDNLKPRYSPLYNQDSHFSWYNCLYRVRVCLVCSTNGDVSISDNYFNSGRNNDCTNRDITKEYGFESGTIKWIVSPMGNNPTTTKLHRDIKCSIVTGIDTKNRHQYQIMCGASVRKI